MKIYIRIFLVLTIVMIVMFSVNYISHLPCRGLLGRPAIDTGFRIAKGEPASYIFGDEEFQAWSVNACLYGYRSFDNYSFIKVGFFDKYWISHKYEVRIGDGRGELGFCLDDGEGNKCEIINYKDVEKFLSGGRKIELFLVVKDRSNVVMPEDLDRAEYEKYLSKFQEALNVENKFPSPGDQYFYTSQIGIKSYLP